MAISRAKRALLAAAALASTAAAIAQDRQSPESLLPPGFGEPPAPAPAPTSAAPTGSAAPAPSPDGALPPLPPLVLPSPTPSPSPTTPPPPQYQLPDFARRSLGRVGVTDVVDGPPANAYGVADGRYLETLMRRLSAPLPSRWLSIALRRSLVAAVDTPDGVHGADFAAERAWLLLRMGESVAARAVAQGVDTDNITPKLRQVLMQAALANADPGALCPIAGADGPVPWNERGWLLARAMCAGLTGGSGAQQIVKDVQRRRWATDIDLQLAQKVMGAGMNSRQAITIEWAPVTQLTSWRFGLATATGVEVPEELYATVGPQVVGWRALAPAIPLAQRAAPAEAAAALGIVSNTALVDLYSALADDADAPSGPAGTANELRDAYVGVDRPTRLAAFKSLWDGGETPAARYARLVLTARAAARLAVVDGLAEADRLVAAMLSAGMDRTALRWQGHVPEGGDGWAMLLLADPQGGTGWGDLSDYAPTGGAAQRKRQLFFAGMAGLGRLPSDEIEQAAQTLDVRIGAENPWTRALDAAVRERQPGTVVLLAAIGMQTGSWGGVPPAALYRIVAALRGVGMEGEARMIAAEALMRL